MASKVARSKDDVSELLKDMLIVHLGLAHVPQETIRQIVRCDIVRVNGIVKHLRAAERGAAR